MSPPPHPPPVPTDTRILEPDEQWKANLRKRIEHSLRHMVEDAQIERDTILNSQPSESSRVRAQRHYEESMNNIRMLAQEEFNRVLRQEMSERKWAFDVVDSNSSQWSLNNIRNTDEGRTPFLPPDAPQNAKGVLSAGIPQQQSDGNSEQSPDGSSEDDDDADDPHRHPLWRHGQGRQPYFPPHGGTERPPTQNRDRIASNISIAPRLRQTSASASSHDRPSPPTYPTALRTTPGARPPFDEGVRFPTSARPSSRPMYGVQRSPEEMSRGIAIPRGPNIPEEGPRGTSWGSLNSRRAFGDFNSKDEQRVPPIEGDLSDFSDDGFGHPDGRQNVRSTRNVLNAMNIEQLIAWWETEAQRNEDEANRKEEEASRKEQEARRLEEKARQSLEEARRLEAYARQAEASAKTREIEAMKREAEAQKREAEVHRKEEEVRHREIEVRRKEEQVHRKEEAQAQWKEGDARKREEVLRRKEDGARQREDSARRKEEDARQREMLARQKEEDARRFEEEARRKEDEARRKEEESNRIKEDYERKKREIERKEAELKKREAELLRREQARLVQEETVRRAKENSRLAGHGDEDAARLDPGERHQRELEERLHLEQRLLEERRKQEALQQEREEQIRLDEELSRQEQARLDREALLEQKRLVAEAQEREAIRVQEVQRRTAEEEQLRVVEEQRRKAEEKSRQRDELSQQQQQDEALKQRAWEEQQKEFERRAAQYHQRKLDRERQNNMSSSFDSRATPHQSGSTTGSAGVRNNAPSTSTFSSSPGLTWSNRPSSTSNSHNTSSLFTSSFIPFSTAPKPSTMGARTGAPGTSMARALKGEDRYGS